MMPTLRNHHFVTIHLVHDAMLVGNSAGPETCQIVLQRLRLAQARKRVALNVTNQLIDFAQHLLVILLPEQIVFPGCRFK